MDTQLARVVFILKVAAKLKKNNPELSDAFIRKNKSYFPNKSDVQVVFERSKNKSNVIVSGSSNPEKNITNEEGERKKERNHLTKRTRKKN